MTKALKNKIFGVIPIRDDNDDENMMKFNRAVESAILNIECIDEYKDQPSKLILFTSPTENNGKSLLSRNVAKRLAEMGKRTLLIDNDLIRGDQHKFLNTNKITYDQFNNISNKNISNYLVSQNLYFIPKVSRLTDTFNFLYNDLYINKINELRDYFEYIIFDSAPILSVSDTSILMNYSDINLLVIRHNISKISQIKQSLYLADQINQVRF